MAGHGLDDDPNLKGLARHFNNQTVRGRANVAKATYAVIGVVILYNLIKPKKK